MSERTCTLCQETKSISEFYMTRRLDGSTYPRGRCRACDAKNAKKRYARKAEFRCPCCDANLSEWRQFMKELAQNESSE